MMSAAEKHRSPTWLNCFAVWVDQLACACGQADAEECSSESAGSTRLLMGNAQHDCIFIDTSGRMDLLLLSLPTPCLL